MFVGEEVCGGVVDVGDGCCGYGLELVVCVVGGVCNGFKYCVGGFVLFLRFFFGVVDDEDVVSG